MHKFNYYFVLTFFKHEKIILTSDSIRRLPAVVRVVTMFLCVLVCVLNKRVWFWTVLLSSRALNVVCVFMIRIIC